LNSSSNWPTLEPRLYIKQEGGGEESTFKHVKRRILKLVVIFVDSKRVFFFIQVGMLPSHAVVFRLCRDRDRGKGSRGCGFTWREAFFLDSGAAVGKNMKTFKLAH